MKTTAIILSAILLGSAAYALPENENTDAEENARVLDEVTTTERQSDRKHRMYGAGEELVANEDRPWREQITCKTQRVTGSRIAKERICRTNAQWAAQQQETQRSLNIKMARPGSNQ